MKLSRRARYTLTFGFGLGFLLSHIGHPYYDWRYWLILLYTNISALWVGFPTEDE